MHVYLPYIRARLATLLGDQKGTVGIEYILVAGLIALAFVAGAGVLGGAIQTQLNAVGLYVKGIVVP